MIRPYDAPSTRRQQALVRIPAGIPGADTRLETHKEAVFLTAKTTSMVCWLFVGSALFSAVFAILGGKALLESWVAS